jgi:uncharacterized protein YcbX
MHTIKDIIIYPIKGLGGVHTLAGEALHAGFRYDRRWMLIDENNQFVTQRSLPQMALFSQKLHGNFLEIMYKGLSIHISTEDHTSQIINTKVWDDDAVTVLCSNEISAWFTEMLHKKVKLVKILDEQSRKHTVQASGKIVDVSLADGYPYLVASEQSLHMLNDKLSSPIKMDRFRPNIVVSADYGHHEDEWQGMEVGTAIFENIKPCGRCNVITIDQQNAHINTEPLRILNQYRKVGNSVNFGTNMICVQEGVITVGDTINLSNL